MNLDSEYHEEFAELKKAHTNEMTTKTCTSLLKLIQKVKQSALADDQKLPLLLDMRHALILWSKALKYPAATINQNMYQLFQTYKLCQTIKKSEPQYDQLTWIWCNLLIHQLNIGAYNEVIDITNTLRAEPNFETKVTEASKCLSTDQPLSVMTIQRLELNALIVFARAKSDVFHSHGLSAGLESQYAKVLEQLKVLTSKKNYHGFFNHEFISREEQQLERYKEDSKQLF